MAAALWDGCEAAVSSRLAHPEVRAALAAAGRGRRLAAAHLEQAASAFEAFWDATWAVDLTDAVARHAVALAAEHALRGADAVHLASALALGTDDLLVAAWDRRLGAGAAAAGLRVVPVQRGSGAGPLAETATCRGLEAARGAGPLS